ncbi:response regulator transcription factor [Paenibacillus koleovorans]|uniref:response regulator transcription factor n=1 Tax=Paenibacillus koleovorans TaxID=121608 RepID=UPI000FD84473|nr:response regulator [Paenibacillus koleovorans]
MVRIIIVDDNPVDRNGIERTMDWAGMGLEVVGSYANGKLALEAIDQVQPDLILCDISMPVMNGIELVEQLRRKGKAHKTIFMSCHDEFQFAKSAIKLDVESYILKPIIPEELQEAIVKAVTKHKAELSRMDEREDMLRLLEQSRPSLIDQFLRQVLFEPALQPEELARKLEYLQLPVSPAHRLHVVSVVVGQEHPAGPDSDIREAFIESFSVKKVIQEHAQDSVHLYSVQIAEREYALLILTEEDPEGSVLDLVVTMKESLLERWGIHSAWGISSPSLGGFREAASLYKQSRIAVKSGYYSDQYPVILYEEIAEQQSFEYQVDLKELFHEVKQLLLEGDRVSIEQFCDRYIKIHSTGYAEGYIKSFVYSVLNIMQIQLLEMNESFSKVFGNEIAIWSKLSEFETVQEVRSWLSDIFDTVIHFLHIDRKTEYSRVVEDIKQIIKARYHEPLTVNEIAKSIFSSVSHANSTFKKVTGKTIFDSLIEYRVEVAKMLLRDPSARIYAVAEQVGYSNKSHFCLLFKKYSGLSPQEFKTKYAGNHK